MKAWARAFSICSASNFDVSFSQGSSKDCGVLSRMRINVRLSSRWEKLAEKARVLKVLLFRFNSKFLSDLLSSDDSEEDMEVAFSRQR